MTPGHAWLDYIGKVLSRLGGVVAPVRREQDKRNIFGLAGSSGLIYLIILINGINEVCSI